MKINKNSIRFKQFTSLIYSESKIKNLKKKKEINSIKLFYNRKKLNAILLF